MTLVLHQGGADDTAEAAAWVVRLAAEDAGAEDVAAFEAWLAGAPGRAEAYDAALAVWSLPFAEAGAARLRVAPARLGRGWMLGGGMAAAAALVVALVISAQPRVDRYVAAPGQTREIALADGTSVALNGGSTLEVGFRPHERDVRLPQGEAAFDVAHDAARPFVIRSGDRSVRVVGTAFDVKARGELFEVIVSRGVVDVSSAADATPVRLTRGDKLRFAGNAPAVRSTVDPEEAAAWRQGRLIYHAAPLSEVVQDLNVQFGQPYIRVSTGAGALTFSGSLVLDGRDAVVRRLTYALPIRSQSTASGLDLDLAAPTRR